MNPSSHDQNFETISLSSLVYNPSKLVYFNFVFIFCPRSLQNIFHTVHALNLAKNLHSVATFSHAVVFFVQLMKGWCSSRWLHE
jgi:hypothetical protein